jgi:hypothetical protein
VLAIFDVSNAYGNFKRFEVMDFDWSLPGSKRNGNGSAAEWATPDGPGKAIFTEQGVSRYAIYSVDESSGRAHLKLEWQAGTYPATFTTNAAIYVERTATYLQDDAMKIGVLK